MKKTFLRVSPYVLKSWIRMLSFKQFLRSPWILKRKKGHMSSEATAQHVSSGPIFLVHLPVGAAPCTGGLTVPVTPIGCGEPAGAPLPDGG